MRAQSSQTGQQISLAQLFPAEILAESDAELLVTGVQLDSRRVSPGDLFVAATGYRDDGSRYIDKAVERGAVAIAVDAAMMKELEHQPVPLIAVADLKRQVSAIAGRFYGEPSRQLEVIGITGTNGKTSCCQFIAKAFTHLGIQCGVIGTIGFGLVDALQKTENTTPDAVAMQRMLAQMVDQHFDAVALEVSSHGMDQGRVQDVAFDTVVFTNLTRDHLDYHGDMESYAASKAALFFLPGIKHAVINLDDEYGRSLVEQLPDSIACYGYSVGDRDAALSVTSLEYSSYGIKASLRTPWGEGILASSLLGRFNLENLLVVVAVLCAQGVSLDRVLAAVSQLEGVPGRMQRFGGNGLPLVVVDYAHTPDALKAVLTVLRELGTGEVWCVFGCGGERDQGKRALMGEVAERLADTLVLTNDNPRGEEPRQIIRDIEAGLRKPGKAIVELDRSQAIQLAVRNAGPQDLVLIAGKGHEDYQEIKGARRAFSDAEQVRQALNIKRLTDED